MNDRISFVNHANFVKCATYRIKYNSKFEKKKKITKTPCNPLSNMV